MELFGLFSLTHLLCAGLAAASFLGLVAVAFKGGLMTMWGRWAALKRFLTAPEKAGLRVRALLLLAVLVPSSCGSLVSIAIGDAQANKPCKETCRAQGWADGRWCVSPHVKDPALRNKLPYECWCTTGKDWSEEPIDREAAGGRPPRGMGR